MTASPSRGLPDWTVLFGRSRVAPCLFTVHGARPVSTPVPDWGNDPVREYVRSLGVPMAWEPGLYMPAIASWPLLDGAVSHLQTYGMPPMPGGTRVVGTRPLRLLCHELGLRPPRRLREEVGPIFGPEALREDLAAMLARPEEDLLAQAQKASFYDTAGALWAVRDLLGDGVMPPAGTGDDAVLPASGAWGDARFTRAEAAALDAAGLAPAQAQGIADRLAARYQGWVRATADQVIAASDRGGDNAPSPA